MTHTEDTKKVESEESREGERRGVEISKLALKKSQGPYMQQR